MFKKFYLLIGGLFGGLCSILAQQPLSSSQLLHALEGLPVCANVLYVAAHPDDENTRLISFLTNELHCRTAYLSLTRGDGGQNLIGNEQSEQLGLIRTQELLAARQIDGGEQYFSRAFDFGFSKSPEETFKFWEKEKVLADAVWVIRKFRPDIIICRFPTTGEGGHGHHTASAIIAEEAFEAAADPKRFSEQLKHVEVWQAKRLLWNTFNFGSANTIKPDQFKTEVGAYNSLLGKSYGEIAAESRSCHSSQAFGTAKNRATQQEYFKTIKGTAPKESLLDEVNTSMTRFASPEIEEMTQRIIRKFDVRSPDKIVPDLIELYDKLSTTKSGDTPMLAYKLSQIKLLIKACMGLYAEAVCTRQYVAIGDTVSIQANIINRSTINLKLKSISILGAQLKFDTTLMAGRLFNHLQSIQIDDSLTISQPYWLSKPITKGMFQVDSQLLIGSAQNEPSLSLVVNAELNGKPFDFKLPLQYKKIDPASGEVYQPIYITPPATVTFQKEVYVLANGNKKNIELRVKAFKKNVEGAVSLKLPAGWVTTSSSVSFKLENEGDEKLIAFMIDAPKARKLDTVYNISATLKLANGEFNKSFTSIKYNHIPNLVLFNDANCKIADVALKSTSTKIGYINGAGDKIPEVLTETGMVVQEITDNDILQNSLSRFNAIVVGVRAYNTVTQLKNWQPVLMKYVQDGGRLLVQYNTSQSILTSDFGPYPFKISRDRVTEEDAEVRFLDSSDVLLNTPNKLTQKDFSGWVQERGLYFPTDTDPRYKKILSMNDTDEKPLDNAIIYANYGKGRYVYTGLSFFRELPAGVPGAYKLFANLIAR